MREKSSHPAYKPPPAFRTEAKVAKGGAYLRDTTVIAYGSTFEIQCNLSSMETFGTKANVQISEVFLIPECHAHRHTLQVDVRSKGIAYQHWSHSQVPTNVAYFHVSSPAVLKVLSSLFYSKNGTSTPRPVHF